MKVTLEWFEVSRAALVGVSRNVEALRKQCKSRMKALDCWEAHILGALGEAAYAKTANRYWSGSVNTFKDPDIGADVQIRTRSHDHYDLIVRDADADRDVFVLVTGGPSEFVIRGWIHGSDAKKPQWEKDYGGHGKAWFVPQSALHPIEMLISKEV